MWQTENGEKFSAKSDRFTHPKKILPLMEDKAEGY